MPTALRLKLFGGEPLLPPLLPPRALLPPLLPPFLPPLLFCLFGPPVNPGLNYEGGKLEIGHAQGRRCLRYAAPAPAFAGILAPTSARGFAAERRPHSTAFGRQSCGTEGARVAIPGPRSRCTPGLSCAADARVYTELGSRAKTGLGARRSPQKAVLHRRRTERRLAIAQRSRSASAHLRRRAHERPQPGAAPGCNLPFLTLSIGLDPEGHRT